MKRCWLALLLCPWLSSCGKPLALQGPRPDPAPEIVAADLEKSISRGIQFLLQHQNKNGSWGSAHKPTKYDLWARAPGSFEAMRCAVTGLCVRALVESRGNTPELMGALDRATDYLLERLPTVRRDEPALLTNIWAYIYGLEGVASLLTCDHFDDTRRQQLAALASQQVSMLERFEFVGGGWGYYDFRSQTQKPGTHNVNSFTTASALAALLLARDVGVEIPQKLIDRSIAAIRRQRTPLGSYVYGYTSIQRPGSYINRPSGALGRTQTCNFALHRAGCSEITQDVMCLWLDRLYARQGWLDMGRKRPIPHESYCAVAAYFFLYGMYYAGLQLDLIEADNKSRHQKQMADVIMGIQEKDGSWWDYPLYNYHKYYGTPMALLVLMRCRPTPLDPSPAAR